ncbi:12214_t:CDS:1, partial [Acaulospora morrowiae]
YHHTKRLHDILFQFEDVLMGNPIPTAKILGEKQEAYVYGNINSAKSLIFLCNADEKESKQMSFCNSLWNIPRWSISILQGSDNSLETPSLSLLMNTATIESPKSSPDRLVFRILPESVIDTGSFFSLSEPIPLSVDSCEKKSLRPPPQIATTQDTTDYMWLVTNLTIEREKIQDQTLNKFILKLHNVGDVGTVYIDGKMQSVYRGGNEVHLPLDLNYTRDFFRDGIHPDNRKEYIFTLQILNGLMGLKHLEIHMEKYEQGILGDVYLNNKQITSAGWGINIGLVGEKERYFDPVTHSSLLWKSMNFEESFSMTTNILKEGLVWYKFQFTLPDEYHDVTRAEDTLPPIALDLISMGKGNVWVNGRHLGRYWLELATRPTDPRAREDQDYAGWYNPHIKCRVGYDVPSQRCYHIPLEWMKRCGEDRKNIVVLFEEWGGDPLKIRVVQRVKCNICEPDEICTH